MQIRELHLNEITDIYKLFSSKIDISYNDFEDNIYEMREQNYKMFGLYDRELLVSFAGLSILNTLQTKRYILVHEIITEKTYQLEGYDREMFAYIFDYAKILNCTQVVLKANIEDFDEFFILREFKKEEMIYIKEI